MSLHQESKHQNNQLKLSPPIRCDVISHLAELLSQEVPLLCVGFAQLLFVPNEQSQFADGTIQQILRALLHEMTENVGLRDQHGPRLVETKGTQVNKLLSRCCLNVW